MTRAERLKDRVESFARRRMSAGSLLGALLRPIAYAIPHWWAVALMGLATAAYAACHQGRLVIFKPLVDDIATEGVSFPKDRLWLLFFILVSLAAGESVFRLTKDYYSKYARFRAHVDIWRHAFNVTVKQDMAFFSRWRLGAIFQRMEDDLNLAASILDIVLDDMVMEPFMIAAAAGVAFAICWQLSLIAIGVLVIVVIPLIVLGKKIRKQAAKRQTYRAVIVQRMMQMLTGFKTVKLFGREQHEATLFHRETGQLFRKAMRLVLTKALSVAGTTFLSGLLVATAVLLGMLAIRSKIWGLTPGDLTVFLFAVQSMIQPVRHLTRVYGNVHEALAGSQRVFGYLDSVPPPQERGGRPMEDIAPSVVFEDVSFGYGDEAVLQGVSFSARPGEVVALVGRSGSGKTTLLDLVARIYRPRSGRILVGGVPLDEIDLDSYLAHVAMVPQDPFLFATDIRENIVYGRFDATDAEVVEAAQVANIHDFVASLPEGYATIVGDRGATLSGGQRQRIAIARAVLKRAKILLLDEATSALDAESERAFYDALERLLRSGPRTVFIVAHRLSTVTNADRILVLDAGRIVEQGTHEELMGRQGAYRQLFETQFKEATARTGSGPESGPDGR